MIGSHGIKVNVSRIMMTHLSWSVGRDRGGCVGLHGTTPPAAIIGPREKTSSCTLWTVRK